MFKRFTEPARQVVVFAQDESRALKHNYKHDHIATEHILLGLLGEQDGNARKVLHSLGITLDEVRPFVTRIVGLGDGSRPARSRSRRTPKRFLS